jgi:hypothetical protein
LQNEQLLAALEKIWMWSEYYNSNFSFGGSESFVFIADEKTYDLIENFHDDEVFTNLYEKLGATHHEQVIMADENKAPKHIRIWVKMMANKADPSLSEFFERYWKGQRESIWRWEKASQKSWDDSSWSRGA